MYDSDIIYSLFYQFDSNFYESVEMRTGCFITI